MCYVLQALADLDAAAAIAGDNEALKDDLEELRRAATSNPYIKCKEAGDKAFKMGDTDAALVWYTKALEADEVLHA